MKCPHCNYNTPDNSVKCCVCDKPISASSTQPTQSSQSEWKEFAKFSRDAIPYFANKGILLDSTPASLLGLDIYMDETWGTDGLDTGDKGVTPGDQHQREMWMMGCYLGEMLKTIMKGEWKPDPQHGDNVWFYLIASPNDVRICPHAWLRKRWKYGAGDRLYDKLIGIVGMYGGKQSIKSIDGETIPVPKLDLSFSNKPADWLKHGNHYFGNGRWQMALRFFEIATKLNSGLASAWFGAAQCQEKLNLPQKATESYRKFLELAERDQSRYAAEIDSARKKIAAIENQKSDVVWETSAESIEDAISRGMQSFKSGKFNEALSAFEDGLRIEPDSIMCLMNKAASLTQLGRHEDAIPVFERVIVLNPDLCEAWHGKGLCFTMLGKLKDAIDCYDRARQINPNHANDKALTNEGNCRCDTGDIEGGIKCYDRAIEINPRNALAFYNKGRALWEQGKFEEALDAHTRACEIDPGYANAVFQKAFVADKLGRLHEALKSYQQFLKLKSTNQKQIDHANTRVGKLIYEKPQEGGDSDFWGRKGVDLCQQNKIQDGLYCFTDCVKLNPNNPLGWFFKGKAEYTLGLIQDASASLQRFISIAPQFDVQKLQANIKEAQTMLDDLRNDPSVVTEGKSVLDLKKRAWSLGLKGRVKEALSCILAAVAIEPDDFELWQMKSIYEEQLGMTKEAIRSCQKYIQLAPPEMESVIEKVKERLKRLGGEVPAKRRNIEKPTTKNTAQAKQLVREANEHLQKQRLAEALRLTDIAISHDADYVAAHFLRGTCLYMLGRFREALSSLNKVLELAPDDKMVHFTKGLVEFELRMTTEAVVSLKKFLAHADPKFQQQIKIARDYLQKMGVNPEEKTTKTSEPNNGMSAMLLAVSLALKGEKQKAVEMFAKAVQLSPKDALIWWTKGTFEDKYGMKADAIESFKKVLVLAGPDMAETLQKTKARLRELGVDPEKDVPNVASLISEGKAFMEKRRYSLAVGSFEKAIAIDGNNAEAWFLKAQAEEMSGLKRRAIESYRRFLQLASPERHGAQIEIAKKLLESVK